MSLRSSSWPSRLKLAAITCVAAVLTACGGDVYQPFEPQRILSIGDEYSYIDATTGAKYTINALRTDAAGASVPNCDGYWLWTQYVAFEYGFRFAECPEAGAAPDTRARALAKEGSKVADVATQLDAAGGVQANDMILVQVGANDVWELYNQYGTTAATLDAVKAQANSRGKALAAQLLAWTEKGARIIVMDVTDQSDTPEARSATGADVFNGLEQLSTAFNEGLRAGLSGDQRKIALILANNRVKEAVDDERYNFDNRTDAACVDGLASPKLCNTGTLKPDVDPNVDNANYIFSSGRYLTPVMHRLLGDLARSQADRQPF
ncbi:SGNH/GDSL hydrolase family protein [Caldimonas brevitalea]|uniref:Phospholipase/lecithinase/hemolysin n=1 Tax=Caldimonas brevitalea TaxID=413882 RepID=A0A0G3BE83_9BURK|nr:SGNH/GDSL hydrolase family protein [Caldimonas brevitalea]AKJ27617.1 phospholipase/lecithinase/hemolysin [Caldimonas brevitalea]